MSEYQYYEFAAVDRPLSARQQAELRSRSTRATITADCFINEYHWGDLKGDPLDWMQRYFDAHVYSANWGSCRLLLRLPRGTLDAAALDDFTRPSQTGAESGFAEAFAATAGKECWILDWSCADDSGWGGHDGHGWMARLLPLRDELLHGDSRPLYLGWLARVGQGELAGDDPEPPLPAGLAALTPAQAALAEFLLLDPDWLAAAAEFSPATAVPPQEDPDRESWLGEQSVATMQASLRLLLEGRAQEAERDLRQRFLAWQRARQAPIAVPPSRRVAQIEARLETFRSQRLERERLARTAEDARRQAERLRHLLRLLEDPARVWQDIDQTLQRGTGAAYDEALRATLDLAEAMRQAGRDADFRQGLVRLLSSHAKRPAWVARLRKAGQWEAGE